MKFLRSLATTVACVSAVQASAIPIVLKRDNQIAGALTRTNAKDGKVIKQGTELRILGVGDSITVGFPGRVDGGDGNGYREQLIKDLVGNDLNIAGAVTANGTINQNYFAAWSGKTIKYIQDHMGPSLKQNPNIILVHAGTNDMNPDPNVSHEGNEPVAASERLGVLVDNIVQEVPEAVVLVAMIIPTCNADQAPQTKIYQSLIPGVVAKRRAAGKKVLAVDFSTFSLDDLRDCIHPSDKGYNVFGDYWYDFITQIPTDWISKPIGADPYRPEPIISKGTTGSS